MSYDENREKERSRFKRWFSLRDKYGNFKLGRIAAIFFLLAILLVTFFGGMFYTLGVGEAALIVDPLTGSVSNPIKGPTWSLKNIWQEKVTIYTAIDSLGMWGNGSDQYANYPSIACFSKDQLEMKIDVMLRWQLDVGKIKALYRNYPLTNWKETTIASIVREQIRLTTKDFSAVETIETRDTVRMKILEAIENKLRTEPSLCGAVVNIEFELRNIGYPTTYTQAIEAKLSAEQAKMEAEYEASRRITLAEADAKTVLIAAHASAQMKVIDAEGIKEAISTLTASANMTDEEFNEFLNLYVTLKALENISSEEGIYFFIGFENGLPVLIPQPTP